MIFAHDTVVRVASAAALINTLDGQDDRLSGPAALREFAHEWGWATQSEPTDAELRAVRALRSRLRQLWGSGEDRAAQIVNRMLRQAKATAQLVRHERWGYHLHAIPSDPSLADRMAVDVAMAFADLIRGGQLGRLRFCEFPTCDAVLVDLSKNHSRRFCGGTCGNRAAVAAYRARKASAADAVT